MLQTTGHSVPGRKRRRKNAFLKCSWIELQML